MQLSNLVHIIEVTILLLTLKNSGIEACIYICIHVHVAIAAYTLTKHFCPSHQAFWPAKKCVYVCTGAHPEGVCVGVSGVGDIITSQPSDISHTLRYILTHNLLHSFT